jgi:hypothetical protein
MSPITNVAFNCHLRRLNLFPIKPDEQDYDPTSQAHTPEEQAHQYRLAQGRKMQRLYNEWRSLQKT